MLINPLSDVKFLAEKFSNYRIDCYSFKAMPRWKRELHSYESRTPVKVTLPSLDTTEFKKLVVSLNP